jgi:hypothetical protein
MIFSRSGISEDQKLEGLMALLHRASVLELRDEAKELLVEIDPLLTELFSQKRDAYIGNYIRFLVLYGEHFLGEDPGRVAKRLPLTLSDIDIPGYESELTSLAFYSGIARYRIGELGDAEPLLNRAVQDKETLGAKLRPALVALVDIDRTLGYTDELFADAMSLMSCYSDLRDGLLDWFDDLEEDSIPEFLDLMRLSTELYLSYPDSVERKEERHLIKDWTNIFGNLTNGSATFDPEPYLPLFISSLTRFSEACLSDGETYGLSECETVIKAWMMLFGGVKHGRWSFDLEAPIALCRRICDSFTTMPTGQLLGLIMDIT